MGTRKIKKEMLGLARWCR